MLHSSEEAKYALYPWFPENGSDLVHPDDMARFSKIMPYGKVFMVQHSLNGMVELYYGSEKFRVKPDLLEAVPTPAFEIGQRVHCVANEEIAEVAEIQWHHKEKRPFFILSVGGKQKSRRFWESDLRPS